MLALAKYIKIDMRLYLIIIFVPLTFFNSFKSHIKRYRRSWRSAMHPNVKKNCNKTTLDGTPVRKKIYEKKNNSDWMIDIFYGSFSGWRKRDPLGYSVRHTITN